MPDYHFDLHQEGLLPTSHEQVSAADDQEARTLAEMRLLLGGAFSRVVVNRDGMEPMQVRRDRKPGAPARSPSRRLR